MPVCPDPRSCCQELSRVWRALGIADFTGKSASEHVSELKALASSSLGLPVETVERLSEIKKAAIYHAQFGRPSAFMEIVKIADAIIASASQPYRSGENRIDVDDPHLRMIASASAQGAASAALKLAGCPACADGECPTHLGQAIHPQASVSRPAPQWRPIAEALMQRWRMKARTDAKAGAKEALTSDREYFGRVNAAYVYDECAEELGALIAEVLK